MVSIATATTSSSTVIPSAVCEERSWESFSSLTIFAITAELETISIAATNMDWSGVQPMNTPRSCVRLRMRNAPMPVAIKVGAPMRPNLVRLKPSPMENIRKTRPTCDSAMIRASSMISENGGV
jgi:hypothetical protein